MRTPIIAFVLFAFMLTAISGCALGRKEWPSAQSGEDAFSLKLIEGVRQDQCLLLEMQVEGAVNRLWRASVQYEAVGSEPGQGCDGCPFVARNAVHFMRGQSGFNLDGRNLKLSICGLEPGVEYRFRVSGKNELPTMPMTYSDVYVASP